MVADRLVRTASTQIVTPLIDSTDVQFNPRWHEFTGGAGKGGQAAAA